MKQETSSSAKPHAISIHQQPCVVEVEEVVPTGSLDPDKIHLPGIFVHSIIQGDHEKRIEQRTVREA